MAKNITRYRRYDGVISEIDPYWTTPNRTVNLISESDEYLLIQDYQGLVASIAKGVFRSNNMEIPKGQFELDQSLYQHYFSKSKEKRKGELDWRLLEVFNKVLCNEDLKQLIVNTPEYYLIRPIWLTSMAVFAGSCSNTLGAMLQAWDMSNDLLIHNINAKKFTNRSARQNQLEDGSYSKQDQPEFVCVQELWLMSVRGSPLSGSHQSFAWCSECKEVYVISNHKGGSNLPDSVISNYVKLKSIANTVVLELELELIALERLLAILEN
jgi:hypothetical protein